MGGRRRGRGIVYLRRSGDTQETSLEKQLTWALEAAKQHATPIEATLEDLLYMQANRWHKYKGIYLDDVLSGDDLERPGLQSLIEDFHRHNDRSHLFRLRSNIDWVTVRCRPWCIRSTQRRRPGYRKAPRQ